MAQLHEVSGRGKRAIKTDELAKQYGLNERQTAALRFLLEHGKITIQDFEALNPQVNRRSLQRDLNQMLQKELVREMGKSRTDPNRAYLNIAALERQKL